MVAGATPILLQTATPTPGVGPEELVDFWPLIKRGAWFLTGFLTTTIVGWFVVVPAVSRLVNKRNRENPTIQEAITRYLRVLLVVLAFFIGAGTAGYGRFLSDSAIVIAAATLAIGVSGQTVIGSLVSGIVLVLDPEFNIGNYIEWADGAGTIESITLRVTRVRTPNGALVTIPNTVITGQAITRPYGRKRYRVVEHVGLAYEDDVDEALEQLTSAAADIDDILDDPAPSAYVDELGSDAIIIRIHYWIEDPRGRDIFDIRSRYARSVKSRLEAAGITISPASKRELLGRLAVDEGV